MRLADKAQRIHGILDRLYPEPPIPLLHSDPFSLLVAVALSAQTTDARVNLVTPDLFRRAPTPEAMAALEVEEILAFIRTCGLAPAKSKNLRRMSELLVERHGGVVPRSFAELEALPGVGHKTASVVMSQAFGVPAFAVDTHIHRLAARWGLSDGHSVERTERELKALFPESSWNRLHLQIIYFGREHCPARSHDPEVCPICSWAFVREPEPAKARKRGAATTKAGKRAAKKKTAGKKTAAKATAGKKTAVKKTAGKKTAGKKTASKVTKRRTAKATETKVPSTKSAKVPTAKKTATKKAAKRTTAKVPSAKAKTATKKTAKKKTAAKAAKGTTATKVSSTKKKTAAAKASSKKKAAKGTKTKVPSPSSQAAKKKTAARPKIAAGG
jgi:endonuclease-3